MGSVVEMCRYVEILLSWEWGVGSRGGKEDKGRQGKTRRTRRTREQRGILYNYAPCPMPILSFLVTVVHGSYVGKILPILVKIAVCSSAVG
jgi:hypothetical protein